ncbi:MAG: CrcB family protein [Ornithinimicrobium sp.]
MPLEVWVAVALGGAVGSGIRHLVTAGPWGALRGVFAVNTVGALALGVLVANADSLSPGWFAGLGTGACGAFTTYSTLAVQVWELLHENRTRALGYLLVTTGSGGLAALVPLLLWGH